MNLNKTIGIGVALLLAAVALPTEAAPAACSAGSGVPCTLDATLGINDIAGHGIIGDLVETSQIANDGRLTNDMGDDVTLRLYSFDRNGETDSAASDIFDVRLATPDGDGAVVCPTATTEGTAVSAGSPSEASDADGIRYHDFTVGLDAGAAPGHYCLSVFDPSNGDSTTAQTDRTQVEQFTFVVFSALDIITQMCDADGTCDGPDPDDGSGGTGNFGNIDFGSVNPLAPAASSGALRVGNLASSPFKVSLTWSDLCAGTCTDALDTIETRNNMYVHEAVAAHGSASPITGFACDSTPSGSLLADTGSEHISASPLAVGESAFFRFCIPNVSVTDDAGATTTNGIRSDDDYTGKLTIEIISSIASGANDETSDFHVDLDCLTDNAGNTLSCYNGHFPDRDADGSNAALTTDALGQYCQDSPSDAGLFSTICHTTTNADFEQFSVDGLGTLTTVPTTV